MDLKYCIRLLRVELDNQLLLDVLGDVFAWDVKEFTATGSFVPFYPGIFAVVESCKGISDYLK